MYNLIQFAISPSDELYEPNSIESASSFLMYCSERSDFVLFYPAIVNSFLLHFNSVLLQLEGDKGSRD